MFRFWAMVSRAAQPIVQPPRSLQVVAAAAAQLRPLPPPLAL